MGRVDSQLEAVSLMQVRLQLQGPVAESFAVEVPSGLERVSYGIRLDGDVAAFAGWSVTLADCGADQDSTPFAKLGSGTTFSQVLCEEPAPGDKTLTVESRAAVLDGTFELVGWRQPANETA